MNRNLLTMALLICGLSVNGQKKIDYVDPLIGTNGMGHTFPGAWRTSWVGTAQSGYRYDSA